MYPSYDSMNDHNKYQTQSLVNSLFKLIPCDRSCYTCIQLAEIDTKIIEKTVIKLNYSNFCNSKISTPSSTSRIDDFIDPAPVNLTKAVKCTLSQLSFSEKIPLFYPTTNYKNYYNEFYTAPLISNVTENSKVVASNYETQNSVTHERIVWKSSDKCVPTKVHSSFVNNHMQYENYLNKNVQLGLNYLNYFEKEQNKVTDVPHFKDILTENTQKNNNLHHFNNVFNQINLNATPTFDDCNSHLEKNTFSSRKNQSELRHEVGKFLFSKNTKNGRFNSNYFCDCCGKDYTSARQLIRHRNLHSTHKRFKCFYCEKGFNDGFDLKRHIRTHTGIRPFKCDYCPKSFTQRCSVEAHTTKIHNVKKNYRFRERRPKLYVCEECGQTFINNLDHKRHMGTQHSHIKFPFQ